MALRHDVEAVTGLKSGRQTRTCHELIMMSIAGQETWDEPRSMVGHWYERVAMWDLDIVAHFAYSNLGSDRESVSTSRKYFLSRRVTSR